MKRIILLSLLLLPFFGFVKTWTKISSGIHADYYNAFCKRRHYACRILIKLLENHKTVGESFVGIFKIPLINELHFIINKYGLSFKLIEYFKVNKI